MAANEAYLPELFGQMLENIVMVRGIGLILVALAMGLVSFLVISGINKRQKRALAGPDRVAHPGLPADTPLSHSGSGTLTRWMMPAQQYLLPSDKKERISISRRLLQAGFDHEHAPLFYHGLKALVALMLGVLLLLLHPWLPGNLPEYPGLCMIMGTGIGLVIPSSVLDSLQRRRQQQLISGLPQLLDMLQICLSAGLSLPQAISRMQAELGLAHPMLAHEMARVSAELMPGWLWIRRCIIFRKGRVCKRSGGWWQR